METQVPTGSPIPDPALDLQQAIRRRAVEIYIQSGRIPGRDVENWTQAEREILEQAERQNRRRAIIVKVHGVHYVGEYSAESADGYVPGEIGGGHFGWVRIEGDKMFVRRSNGKELQNPDCAKKRVVSRNFVSRIQLDILQACSVCSLPLTNGFLTRRC